MNPLVEWAVFSAFALIAIAGALGMATTMSMFRSGAFLMASFIGVAGLFILLSADLLSLLQIMMYIGGMLVMILFMVLFSHDPGGAMMAAMMDLPALERFFSLGLSGSGHGNNAGNRQHDSSRDDSERENADDAGHRHSSNAPRSAGDHGGGEEKHGKGQSGGEQASGMDMNEMSMTTPLKSYAALLAIATGILLVTLLVLRPSWPLTNKSPDPDSAHRVGSLLMGKYMIAFEGAGLLILLGIFGAVFISRPAEFPDSGARGERVSVDGPPAPVDSPQLEPLAPSPADTHARGISAIEEAHRDTGSEVNHR